MKEEKENPIEAFAEQIAKLLLKQVQFEKRSAEENPKSKNNAEPKRTTRKKHN